MLFIKQQRQGLLISGLSFLLMMTFGAWSIFQSRSSTASIGLLFLPFYASLCGLFIWLFYRFKNHPNLSFRILAWALLAAHFAVYAIWITGAIEQNAKNVESLKIQNEYAEQIKLNRALIQQKLTENPGLEAQWLNSEILKRNNEDQFLIPALESKYVNSETLEKLSSSTSISVVLMVTRNASTPAKALEAIYLKNSPPGYYYQALAAHKNTPPQILRKLHENPGPMQSINQWLAENPATPRDILIKLCRSNEVIVLFSLLKNPTWDCELIGLISENLKRKDLVDTYKYLTTSRNLANEYNAQKCP